MSKQFICEVLPSKYITLPPGENGKSDMVNAGEKFICSSERADHYVVDGLVKIIGPVKEVKDVEPSVDEESTIEDEKSDTEDLDEEVSKPPVIRRRSIR